jgi:hypothetical protein
MTSLSQLIRTGGSQFLQGVMDQRVLKRLAGSILFAGQFDQTRDIRF